VVGVHQALSGDLCAVAAHCSGNGLRTGSHIGSERVLESPRQRVSCWYARCVRGSDAEALDPLCPVVLIVDLRNDDLGCADQRGCGGGARTAVMDDGGDPLEEGLLIDLADGQAVGFAVHERQVGPTAGHDRRPPERAGCLDHHQADVLRRAHAAQTEVDGRLGGVEERLQLSDQNWYGAQQSLERAFELNAGHTKGWLACGRLLEALG